MSCVLVAMSLSLLGQWVGIVDTGVVVTAIIDAGGGVCHPHPRCLIDGDGRCQHWGSGGGCGWQWWQPSSLSACGGRVVDGGHGGGGHAIDAGGWWWSLSMLVVVVVASIIQVM